jgi:uncharacterized MAPEG superfamily protein
VSVHVTLANLGNVASIPLVALLAFAAWALLIVVSILSVRGLMVLTKQRAINDFPSGQPHGPDYYWRLNRAHANALENLAVFAAIVLAGAALGVSSPLLALLAKVVVGARVAQTVFHVSSGGRLAVTLRFSAFAAQLACFVWMIVETLQLATGG